MSITVRQINNDHFDQVLKTTIKDQLDVIDKKILRVTKKLGYNEISHMLPLSFNHVPYDKEVVVNLVYAKILKSLEDRGFSINLSRERSGHTYVHISWYNTTYSDKDIADSMRYVNGKLSSAP